jgi:broad specificity phosphatase PhoE
MLTKTNYNDWSLLMKVKLQARQLCDAVEFGDAEFHEDRLTLDALLASIPSQMVASLADKSAAKDAWDSIVATRVDLNRARKATMQKLRQEWDRLAFRPGEDIDDFALRLSSLVHELARHGDGDIDEQKAVEKYLRVVLKKFTQIALSMETPGPLNLVHRGGDEAAQVGGRS